ncbi:uncharacterized protein T551_02454 [Pneumocystis jirovecii RU7]|uniref:Uncharacterized protein n=1 Tax=Pneumocystis jirovecii (strain RU7) TaxID=1408657 RepID=A0A0W4ZJQ5_PNEJ7|nr:uncharacterized protein T551_02454 [Pneumocystis jirovecii RU7]KTW28604.1 hypothetical protein T551_02454 [Pneumocystis jirovecii RU7]
MKYRRNMFILIFILILSLISDIGAIYSYCKCTCFGNSVILRLNDPTTKNKPCQDCTKKYCLEQNLPICKNAQQKDPEELIKSTDITTVCFQRESVKDMIMVYLFIIITGTLLILAPLRPYTSRCFKGIYRQNH